MNVRELIRAGEASLKPSRAGHAQNEVEWLLGGILGLTRTELYLKEDDVACEIEKIFWDNLGDRIKGVPLQHILGEAPFYGETLKVVPGTFIPRPETEAVVEAFINALGDSGCRSSSSLRLIDAGTGCGAIAIALARRLPTCFVVGIEVSYDALRVAHQNVKRCGLSSRVCLVRGRWMESIRSTFDGIISNPPYVPSSDVDGLPLDVCQEPRISLDGGADGMRDHKELLSQAGLLLKPGGVMGLECGEDQVERLLNCGKDVRWIKDSRPLYDVAGRPRGVVIKRQE